MNLNGLWKIPFRKIYASQIFKVMRLTVLFMMLGTCFLSARSYSQHVRYEGNNVFLEDVLREFSRQTGYYLFYKHNEVKGVKVDNIKTDKTSLEQAMKLLLKGLPFSFSLKENTIIVNRTLQARIQPEPPSVPVQQPVTGVVRSENGEPLPGATIAVQGTTRGTVTGMDGEFEILAEKGQIVTVSLIGYRTQEINIGDSRQLVIALVEDIAGLDEVVVVGFGSQKKVNLTGSVSTVSGDDLSMRPAGQTSAALQGLAPGVTVTQRSGKPGDDAGNIRIRGVGTMGDANPMVLIDGVEGSMNNIDPNLIESISILKDAASASIYGSRAANGVILVTTKRGGQDRISVSYNNYVGWQRPTNMPNMVNALDHLLLTNEAYVNTGRSPLYPEELVEGYIAQNGVSSDEFPNTDWQKETLTGSGLQHSHFVTINGGTKNVRMLASFGYFDQQGLIENTGFRRYTLRNNVDVTFSDKLSARIDLQYVNPITNAPSVSVNDIFQWMNGIPANQLGINSDGSWGVGWNGQNPISAARDRGYSLSREPFGSINAFLNYSPVEWLDVELNYAPKYVAPVSKTFQRMVQSYLPDGTPSFVQPQRSSLTEEYGQQLYNNMRATVTATKSFAEHNFKWLAGASREDFTNQYINGFRDIYVLPDYDVLDAGAAENQRARGSGSDWALQSFFTRLNYNYKEKILFEANARYDGSSRFADGNRYGFFPSMSAGWRFSEEMFMDNVKHVLSEGKIRASWGRLGNQNIGTYPAVVSMDMGVTALGGEVANTAALNNMANRDITWETTEERNIGLDLTFFNRLNITADYYHRRTSDILLGLDIPLIIGLNKPTQNAGVVENKGWELGIGYNSSADRELRYNIDFNLSDVRNKVLDMRGINETSLTVNREGYPINSIFGYRTDGYFQTGEEVENHASQFGSVAPGDLRYIDQNGDGMINLSDRAVIGSTIPRYTFSLTTGLMYKGFDLNAQFQGVGKADGYLYGAGIMPFATTGSIGGTIREDNKDRWTPETPNASYPRLAFGQSNNEQPSDFWLRDASYLRLKNLQIGYSLPGSFLERRNIQNLRIFANGTNLFSIDNFWDGYDVEAPVGYGNFYPQVKVYTFGMQITF